jgi:anti-sigma regulatory factor (Ser/Thr protein kinase)
VDACEDCAHSDPSLVEQILRNLVSNAIKYTREGVVRLFCVHEASALRVQVLDTGTGIPSTHLPYIFDEFYQVGVEANAAREGYGLGLSIVHRLVKLLGLELDVKSEPGKGSVFSLELPAGAVVATGHHRPFGHAPSGPRARNDTRAFWSSRRSCSSTPACGSRASPSTPTSCSGWSALCSRPDFAGLAAQGPRAGSAGFSAGRTRSRTGASCGDY